MAPDSPALVSPALTRALHLRRPPRPSGILDLISDGDRVEKTSGQWRWVCESGRTVTVLGASKTKALASIRRLGRVEYGAAFVQSR